MRFFKRKTIPTADEFDSVMAELYELLNITGFPHSSWVGGEQRSALLVSKLRLDEVCREAYAHGLTATHLNDDLGAEWSDSEATGEGGVSRRVLDGPSMQRRTAEPMTTDLFNISLNATAGSITNKCKNKSPFDCHNPFRLTCMNHGEEMTVRCKRWRTCPGCALWKQVTLTQRLIAGIENAPTGKLPMFFTLMFPLASAPDETEAHRAWRSLVARLRYRGYLGAYGWVLQRQRNETLHFHGIAHLPWFADGSAKWRELLVKSGFGVQNKLVVAERQHAGYCAKYISARLAELAPLRRAYGFSADFPQPKTLTDRAVLAQRYGVVPDSDCDWVSSFELRF